MMVGRNDRNGGDGDGDGDGWWCGSAVVVM